MGTRRGGSSEHPQSMFWAEIRKITELLSESFHFLAVKYLIYLNQRVFVMGIGVTQFVRIRVQANYSYIWRCDLQCKIMTLISNQIKSCESKSFDVFIWDFCSDITSRTQDSFRYVTSGIHAVRWENSRYIMCCLYTGHQMSQGEKK